MGLSWLQPHWGAALPEPPLVLAALKCEAPGAGFPQRSIGGLV